jgi:16S rRNA (cytosine1402-N4)-methyltransferase
VIDVAPGHQTVLLDEAVDLLLWKRGGCYVDGTFGGGGHARAILAADPDSRVIAIDRDLAAVERAERLRREFGDHRMETAHASFGDLGSVLDRLGIDCIDGLLLDLGMYSFQLDDPERGFAFRLDGPLDMRFDQTAGRSAADLISTADEAELAEIIWTFGEERRSRQIARAIVRERAVAPIATTGRLAEIVAREVGRPKSGASPATRTFQALRIAVNDEFAALGSALKAAVGRVSPGGRLVTIAFHSLEDRLVKQFIARESATCVCPPGQPVCTCNQQPRLRRIGSSRRPSAQEQSANPRSRSAIMRVAERLASP